MEAEKLCTILEAVREGRLSVAEAQDRLVALAPLESLPFATIDHQRQVRTGFPEVIFCDGKTPEQAAAIAERIWNRERRLLATRVRDIHADAIRAAIPQARYNAIARTVSAGEPALRSGPPVVIVTAGTSDLPVAEEAAETLAMHGEPICRVTDVGVAAIARVIAHRETLRDAAAIIVVAGMEGALPSVVAGLTPAPVVAVPTSVGYGASFRGLAALLGMLNSCAAGMAVVNIDNGFGAAAVAARILRRQREAGQDGGSPRTELEPGEGPLELPYG